MTPLPYNAHTDIRKPPSIGGSLILLGLFMTGLLFMSYPATITLLTATTILLTIGTRRYFTKIKNTTKSVTIPGIGNIEYKVKPN